MKITTCIITVVLLLQVGQLNAADTVAKKPNSKKPNIVVILADDLGFSDLGCYGGEIRTPNLDALAKQGVRFTQTYNSSRCCPSRASLLTGLYPHQAGIGRFVGNPKAAPPGYQGRLADRCVTLAEVLKPAGYGSYACGKWHVNDPGPIARGFDEFYGFNHGYAVDSWEPAMMIRLPEDRPKRTYAPGEYFATNAITDHALDFLDIARKRKQPYLLYVGYQAAHFPVQAPIKLTESYVATYERGWDVLRAERLQRMKQLGLVDEKLTLPDRSPIDRPDIAKRIGSMTKDGINPAWDSLDKPRRADLARRMAVYAAMVENMDSNIGRLVQSLRDHGELENTLLVFTSDNGACAEWDPFGFDMDPKKFVNPKAGHGIDGGTQALPNVLHEGEDLLKMGGPGSMFSYGCAWANLSNTPLSLYKHYASEGGIHSPMIANWPARIQKPGGVREHLSHLMDISATCVEISGATYPKTFQGHDTLPLEGRSLVPAFLNEAPTKRTLIFEHEHNGAIRDGDWKLVGNDGLNRDGIRPDSKWKLFNLRNDPAELDNLAEKEPARVKDLTRRFLEEAKRTLVLPSP